MARPVFLLTDFGLADPFVGIMKAVVLRLCPSSQIVDLTHDVPPQDLVAGAVVLEDCLPWLPPDAVVCVVVDPGVGSARQAVAVECEGHWFIGPDNGVMEPALRGKTKRVFALREGGEIQPKRSGTFHGRDVFAPAAALLAAGRDATELGDRVTGDGLAALAMPSAEKIAEGARLVVLRADRFGNLALNLRRSELIGLVGGAREEELVLEVAGKRVRGLKRTYADAARGELLFYWNSAGRLEIGVNGGNAAEVLRVRVGDGVELKKNRDEGRGTRDEKKTD